MLISEQTYASRAQTSLYHVGTYQQRSVHGLPWTANALSNGNQRQVILHGLGQREETCTSQKKTRAVASLCVGARRTM